MIVLFKNKATTEIKKQTKNPKPNPLSVHLHKKNECFVNSFTDFFLWQFLNVIISTDIRSLIKGDRRVL